MPWVQVPTARLVIEIGHFPPSRHCVLLSFKRRKKVLIAMVLRSLLLFSESPIMSPNFLNHRKIHRISSSMLSIKKVSKNTHIFSCISKQSNIAARLCGIRGDKSLMRNVGTVMTARSVRIVEDFWIVLVIFVLDLSIDSLNVIPDRAA